MDSFSEKLKKTLKNAAKKLTGAKRRAFEAQTTIDYFQGNTRKAERALGWCRETINKGMKELDSGIFCIERYRDRGQKKTEVRLPNIAEDVRDLVDPQSQADPDFRSTFAYTRVTTKAVRQALIDEKGYSDEELPCENTIGNVLNRLGYRLRRVQKSKPKKKYLKLMKYLQM
jgi:hypothetical protein